MALRIAHITDLHLDEDVPFKNPSLSRARFKTILNDIQNQNIDRIVCTGDIGTSKGIQHFFEQLKDKSLKITPGNHDSFIEISKYYDLGADYGSKKIYSSATSKHLKFIYLDSSLGAIDNKQLTWLKKELPASKPIVIFIHHPIIGLPLKVDSIGKLQNRKELIEILAATNNRIVIYCGHYHMESTMVYKNITQNITPAVAFQIKKNSKTIEIDTNTSGYRIIEIEKNHLSSLVKIVPYAD